MSLEPGPLPERSKNVWLVFRKCKGLYGQLQGEGREDGEAVEVSEHQVPVLVPAEDLVVGRDEAGYPVAGRLAHLIKCFFSKNKSLVGMFAHQVSAIQGEHMQGVACLVVAREDDVALRWKRI